MIRLRRVLCPGLALVALAGCPEDRCRGEQPAFELRIESGPGLDPAWVAELEIHVKAGELDLTKAFPVTGQLDDQLTTVAVTLGRAGLGGFTAEVEVIAHDKNGKELLRTRDTFTGSGDACNFFRVALSCAEGATKSCGSSVGVCRAGLQACIGGFWGTCVGEVRPGAELCDGKDNDCDGKIDVNVAGAPLCDKQQGVCEGARKTCTGGAWRDCETEEYSAAASKVGAQYQTPESSCDQKDNNCDGVTDEGVLDEAKGCWDVKAVFTEAERPIDPGQLRIFGTTVATGQSVAARLDRVDDAPLTTETCLKTYFNAWTIYRKLGPGGARQILVRGNSKPDCSTYPHFQPASAGTITLGPGWTIDAVSCPTNNCTAGARGEKVVTWEARAGCYGCCHCPDGATVSIDVTVKKQ